MLYLLSALGNRSSFAFDFSEVYTRSDPGEVSLAK